MWLAEKLDWKGLNEFLEEINKNKEDYYQSQIVSFTKNVWLEMIHSEGH
jgi:hypothetical protein